MGSDLLKVCDKQLSYGLAFGVRMLLLYLLEKSLFSGSLILIILYRITF